MRGEHARLASDLGGNVRYLSGGVGSGKSAGECAGVDVLDAGGSCLTLGQSFSLGVGMDQNALICSHSSGVGSGGGGGM